MPRAGLRSTVMGNKSSTGNAEKLGVVAERGSDYDVTYLTQPEEEDETGNELYANFTNKNRTKRKKKHMSYPKSGTKFTPQHVHAHDWKAMIALSIKNSQTIINVNSPSTAQQRAHSETISSLASEITLSKHNMQTWIEQKFKRRECCVFIRSSKDPEKCGCGRFQLAHDHYALSATQSHSHSHAHSLNRHGSIDRWSIQRHTIALSTNAYGNIEFLGNQHPYKAQYIRLDFNSAPSDILTLFERLWALELPRLIISVHGGHKNFDLQPKLARIFRNGLINAAKATNAWIITSGLDEGVVKYVSAALEPAINPSKTKIVSIGIAPWGLVKRRDLLIGKNTNVIYHPQQFSKNNFTGINERHSYYLLADNGTVGRYGAEIILRQKLESFLMEQRKIPIVCVLLEGGVSSVKTVLEYTTIAPTVPISVPVIVCDGSGRTSDIISFVHRNITKEGKLPEEIYDQLLETVKEIFWFDNDNAENMIQDILASVANKRLITIFRMDKGPSHTLDHSILTALLKGHHLSPSEQLLLTIAWNRVDIAKTDIFIHGREWPTEILHDAMMKALMENRVDFVRLLLEKGVNMKNFLTISRLEELYNTDKGPQNTLHFIIKDVIRVKKNYRYCLPHIGLVTEKLIGHGFRSSYTSQEFREKYYSIHKAVKQIGKINNHAKIYPEDNGINPAAGEHKNLPSRSQSSFFKIHRLPIHKSSKTETSIDIEEEENHMEFEKLQYPFSDLFIWAVLTKRQDMAICMWEHGEEALAKALIGTRLYKSLAKEAVEDYIESEICAELRDYQEQFHTRALELLEQCYRHDDDVTAQLLTYELSYWGNETCLSLAVICNSKAFLAHPCLQVLLSDLWHGGLRIRRHTNIKAIFGILLTPTIFWLDFKSKEELMLQAKTVSEHEHEIHEHESSSSDDSSSSDSSSSSEWDSSDDEMINRPSKRASIISTLSNDRNVFQTIREQLGSRAHELSAEIRRRTSSVLSAATASTVKKTKNLKKQTQKVVTISTNAESVNEINQKKSFSSPYQAFHTNKPKQINWKRKLYEFFQAPITTFWTWAMSYAIFMCVLIYTLLVKTPDNLSGCEWYLFAYVASCGLESCRRFMMSSPARFREKFHLYFGSFWNTLTLIAVVGFLIGFAFRIMPVIIITESRPKQTISYYDLNLKKDVGRILFAVDSIFWVLKMLEYLSIHPKFGPYVYASGKMMLSSVYIILLLALALLSFGLERQSILFPNEEWHWLLVRNIFYKPYYMVYGEVYAGEIDLCDDDAWDGHLEDGMPLSNWSRPDTLNCVPGYWIPPLIMAIFMIVATFLLLSMLIATYNNIFTEANQIANQIWLFQRYNQVIQYECTPCIPPPFTPLYYFFMLYKYAKYKIKENSQADRNSSQGSYKHKHLFELSLKLYLSHDQIEKLHDFEEECMDDLSKTKEQTKNKSIEERIKRTAERSEITYSKLKEIDKKETDVLEILDIFEQKLDEKATVQEEILKQLKQISDELYMLRFNKHPDMELRVPTPENILSRTSSIRSVCAVPKSPLSRRKRISTMIATNANIEREESYSAIENETFDSRTETEDE